MPPLPTSPRVPDANRDYDTALESIARLRDYLRAKGLAPDHPHIREVEDIWWRTKRFLESIDRAPDPEDVSAVDGPEFYRLFER